MALKKVICLTLFFFLLKITSFRNLTTAQLRVETKGTLFKNQIKISHSLHSKKVCSLIYFYQFSLKFFWKHWYWYQPFAKHREMLTQKKKTHITICMMSLKRTPNSAKISTYVRIIGKDFTFIKIDWMLFIFINLTKSPKNPSNIKTIIIIIQFKSSC